MKHIVFVAHLSELSGAGVALVDTVAALSARGFKTSLILPGSGDLVARAKQHNIEPVIINNPEIAITGRSFTRKLGLMRQRANYVQNLTRYLRNTEADLCYINTSTTIFPAIAARRAKIPIAWHIHETLDCPDRRTRIKKGLIRRWADGIIYASHTGKITLPHPDAKPGIVARNFVDIKGLAPLGQRRLTTTMQSRSLSPEILMNGTFYRKAPDILLQAASWLDSPPHITIVGPPPTDPGYASQLQILTATAALKDRVSFVGVQESLRPLYERASLFVSASRNEALPISIVEAMAAGVPVISTDVGDCADLLEAGKCGWVIPSESPEALADAIRDALDNPALAHQKAEAAYTKVMQVYGDKNFWDPLVNFLNKLIK